MTSSLSSPSPYEITSQSKTSRHASSNSYYFTTDKAIEYEIYFTEGSSYGHGLSFADNIVVFGFKPIDPSNFFQRYNPFRRERKNDPRIMATVLMAVRQFFTYNPSGILIFSCDTSDSRQNERSRLFSRYYRTNQSTGIFKKDLPPYEDILVSILYYETNPFREEIEKFVPSIEGKDE